MAGELELSVASAVACSLTAGVPVPLAKPQFLLKCPSAHCSRLLRAADMHAMAYAEAAPRGQGAVSPPAVVSPALRRRPTKFLTLHMAAVSGQQPPPLGCRGADVPVAHAAVGAASDGALVRPPGLHVSAEVAGMEFCVNTGVLVMALDWLSELSRCQKHSCRHPNPELGATSIAAKSPESATKGSGPHLLDQTRKAEPLGPDSNLEQMVYQTFADNNIPVHKPLRLPVLSLTYYCPGVCYVFRKRLPDALSSTMRGTLLSFAQCTAGHDMKKQACSPVECTWHVELFQ